MNTHDKIELPPLPEWVDWPVTVSEMSASEIKEAMQAYAHAAIEADRKRRGEPVVAELPVKGKLHGPFGWIANTTNPETVDKGPWRVGVNRNDRRTFIESDDFTHDVRLYVDGDFADQDEKLAYALGIADKLNTAPQPLSESDIPAEPNPAKCAECGAEMIHVRPGKWQHPDCSQSFRAAEPVTLECQKCGVDRAKVPCAGNLMDCEFKGVAHAVEPVKKKPYAQGSALGEFGIIPMCDQVDDEPVKVPSDDEIMSVVRYSTVGSAAIQYDEWCAFARAILARYGQQAHTSVPEPLKYGREWKDHYVTGWNNCRAAMLAAEQQPQQDAPTPEEEEAWQRMERRS